MIGGLFRPWARIVGTGDTQTNNGAHFVITFFVLVTACLSLPSPRRKMQKKLADATRIDSVGSKTRGGSVIHGAAAFATEDTSDAATAARRERGLDNRRVRLTVERSKRQRHLFKTDWGKSIHEVEEGCRGMLILVSRDEEEDAEIALFYKVRCGVRAACRFPWLSFERRETPLLACFAVGVGVRGVPAFVFLCVSCSWRMCVSYILIRV